jgi:hypothetical protein
MANSRINNATELRAEIARLKISREEQGKAIGQRFSSVGATFSTVMSLFPKSNQGQGSKYDIFHQDLFGVLSRIFLPFALNKTFFRNSNFIVKGLIGLLSQKASHYINEDSVTGVWDKVKSLFTKKHKDVDYGIPPESEAS